MQKQAQSLSTALDESVEPIQNPNPVEAPIDREAQSQRLRARFEAQLAEMRSEASQHNYVALFADCLTWELALCIVRHGAIVAGDILARLGGHVNRVLEYQTAQREADSVREQGLQTH